MDGVTPYRISHPGPGGLIFGYAAASEQAIAEGVGILARVIGRGGAHAASFGPGGTART
jgi:DNA-binding transcriptional MocR family regulator